MEKDIPNVICVLHKHCAGECEPAVHPSLLHADHKVFHPCNHRLVSFLLYMTILSSYIFLFCNSFRMMIISDQCNLFSSIETRCSDSSVVGVEEILRMAHLGFFGPYSGRHSPDFCNGAKLQHVWLLRRHGGLPGHIHKDHFGRVTAPWIQIRQV